MKKLSEYIREQERDAAKHEELRLGQLRAWIDELDQHEPAKNEATKDVRLLVRSGDVRALGLACDKCDTELAILRPAHVYIGDVTVGCAGCGWQGYLRQDWVPGR